MFTNPETDITRLTMGLAGCGGMALRHLYGLQALAEIRDSLPASTPQIEILAVCDPNRSNAEYIADQTTRLLGVRPVVFDSQAQMLTACPNIDIVNLTTGSDSHHNLAAEALLSGYNVFVEKPLAATVRGCNISFWISKHCLTPL